MAVTKVKAWLAGAVFAGMIGAPGARASHVQFKTMERRTIAGPTKPVFVTVAQRRHNPRPHEVVRQRSKRKSAAVASGSAAGGGAGYVYDRGVRVAR